MKLSPPLLKVLDLSTCHNLHKLVLSPQVRHSTHAHTRTRGWPGFSSCAGHELSLQLCLCPAIAGMVLCCRRHDKHAGFSLQGACPALESLNLSGCPSLEYVLVQSNSLTRIDLSSCGSLNKV